MKRGKGKQLKVWMKMVLWLIKDATSGGKCRLKV
jgi:hypothetical protein